LNFALLCICEHTRIEGLLKRQKLILLSPRRVERSLQLLAAKNPKAFGRVAKVLAERTLFEVLLTGWAIAGIFALASSCLVAVKISTLQYFCILLLLGFAWLWWSFAVSVRVADTFENLGLAIPAK